MKQFGWSRKLAKKIIQMDSKMNIWDKQQQNWIKEILSKSGTELKEISDKNGKSQSIAKLPRQ